MMHLCDNPTPLKAFKDHSEIVVNSNDDDTSSDDDDFEGIKYVEASPLDLKIGCIERIPQDHEDPCLFSILQSSGLQSFADFGIVAGTRYCSVSTRYCSSTRWQTRQYERQACAIMRRLVECKMTKLPLDPAISLVEYLKGRKYPHLLGLYKATRSS
ncbi:hypothetical protein Tco_0215709 [Tanacetum coccineum]